MPDFDVDFCMDGRDRVIAYVADRYGRERVSQIITYGTMAAKAVVRDVGRVLGHPFGLVDRIAKLMKADRDANFTPTNAAGQVVNRWTTTGMLCASASSNESGYITHKAMRSMGLLIFDNQARV
jgi:DNA polymerase III alpha subunit